MIDNYVFSSEHPKELGLTVEDIKKGLYCKGCKHLYRDSGNCTLFDRDIANLDLSYGCVWRYIRRQQQ